MMRFIAWITGGELVYLKDFDNVVYKTVAYTNVFGQRVAYVYFYTKVGLTTLNDDGTVEESYIKIWKKA